MATGIYSIRNKVNGKRYIGSATDLKSRRWTHWKQLSKNEHCNEHLQAAWNKYGSVSFTFEVLEFCSKCDLLVREQHYINLYNSVDKGCGYNICPIAGNTAGITAGADAKWKEHNERKAARQEGWEHVETKQCWRCKEVKVIAAFCRCRSGTDGRSSTCLECRREMKNEQKYGGQVKKCVECEQTKMLTQFWGCSLQEDGHGDRCKICCDQIEATGLRVCKRCLIVKNLDKDFSKMKRWQGRPDHWCKACRVQIVIASRKRLGQ